MCFYFYIFILVDCVCSEVQSFIKIYFGYFRFHPLSEFDEGKRSCRRRLAGHNRRRRKTQPEDVTSRLTIPGDGDNKTSGNLDIVSLLAAITRPQGNMII